MDIEKVNQVIEITAQREKVVSFRNRLASKMGRISIESSSGSSIMMVQKDKSSEYPEAEWKVYDSDIKNLECAHKICEAAEWYYNETLRALNQQIAEYDRQILSL